MSILAAARKSDVAQERAPADNRVVACVGDGLLGPTIASGPNSLSFRPDRLISWLRMLIPDASFPEALALGRQSVATTAVPAQLGGLLDQRPSALLISAGSMDCLATMQGVAPASDASIAILEAIADVALGAGISPLFL